MKMQDIKQLSIEDIENRIKVEKDNLVKYKFNHVVSPLENPMVLKQTRKLIARLNTEKTVRVQKNN